jgi:nicotinamidase-related amidase
MPYENCLAGESSSFTGTELEEGLRERDIERMAICGYMTQMCCDTTARQAFHLGFQVDFLSDATGTLSLQNRAGAVSDCDLHRAVLVTMAMRFVMVMGAEVWIVETAKNKCLTCRS